MSWLYWLDSFFLATLMFALAWLVCLAMVFDRE
jgi:hypothetical protein